MISKNQGEARIKSITSKDHTTYNTIGNFNKLPNQRGVCVVFELAYDAHIAKDVIQVPVELAKLLGNCPVYLVARPNACQKALSQQVNIIHVGDSIPQNDEAYLNQREEKLISNFAWHEEACKQAAEYADILIIYPHFCDYLKCARIFWLAHLLKGRRCAVYLKLDNRIGQYANQALSYSLKAKIKSIKNWLRYIPITVISSESTNTLKEFTNLYSELKYKSFVVQNCPSSVDIANLSQIKSKFVVRKNIFLTVGRLGSHQKATEILLYAWKIAASKCLNWKLYLVGSCDEMFKQEWVKKLQEAGLEDTVEWMGIINDRQLLCEIYSQAKIFLLPSRFEGASIALTEAIYAGCAIIATPVGEIPSLLNDSNPGIIPIENVEALAKAMELFATNEVIIEEQRQILKAKEQQRQWPVQLSVVAERIQQSLT